MDLINVDNEDNYCCQCGDLVREGAVICDECKLVLNWNGIEDNKDVNEQKEPKFEYGSISST